MTRRPGQTERSDSPLRIAVAGAGTIGRAHIGLIGASAECCLAAIVDPAPAAASLAAQAAVPRYRTLAEMLAADKPDGVIIATPNHLHVEHALACIAAKVAVLVEKPMAQTVDDADRLCKAVEASEARVLIGHHRAHSPILSTARELLLQGRLGKLVAVTGAALFCKPERYFSDAPWRRQLGGGPILINLIHEIGNLRSLCGDIVAVQGFASSATRGFEVEDTAAITLRFENGALGTFLVSDTAASACSWEQTSGENQDYASCDDEDCYLLAGTLGSLAIPTMRLRSYADPQKRSWFEPFLTSTTAVERQDPLALQLAHFCSMARGEVAPLVSSRDGLQNLRVVEAIARAIRSGGTVEVDRQH